MNEFSIFVTLKVYAPVLLAALFGAIAHALESVKKAGWKGWLSFLIDVIVCSFVGWVFYQLAMISAPHYAIVCTSIGSYWGTKGFSYAKDWLLNSLKANIK